MKNALRLEGVQLTLFTGYPSVANIYTRSALCILFGVLNQHTINVVCTFNDQIIGIVTSAAWFAFQKITYDCALIPGNTILRVIENKIQAIFTSSVAYVIPVKEAYLRISGNFGDM